jgi:hypothetical protein
VRWPYKKFSKEGKREEEENFGKVGREFVLGESALHKMHLKYGIGVGPFANAGLSSANIVQRLEYRSTFSIKIHQYRNKGTYRRPFLVFTGITLTTFLRDW